jgi:hypothetical protein
MELDINKLRQEAYCYDTDNYGLDIAEEPDDSDWIDDFENQRAVA